MIRSGEMVIRPQAGRGAIRSLVVSGGMLIRPQVGRGGNTTTGWEWRDGTTASFWEGW